jgi:hypothetical protein
VKHPLKVMIWRCFSWKGSGKTEVLRREEMINGKRDLEMLNTKVELFMAQY